METQEKVLICTAAGDDPKAPVSKMLLETKAEAIAAGIKSRIKETAADKACLYIPVQYIEAAEKITGRAGDIQIRTGKDSLVCRDRTALTAAIEQKYIRPFYREDEKALLLENTPVEEVITVEEAVNYAEAKVSKIFFVHGAVEQECFVEFPYGTSVKEIIDSAGGFKKNTQIKTILIGGVLGKFFRPDEIESILTENGNSIFSGDLEVFDTSSCGADIVKKILNDCRNISCGKCPLCREGIYQLSANLNDITNGKGKAEMLPAIKDMASTIELGAFCQFGREAAGLVLSALDVLGAEIEDHVKRKKCPASVCKAFQTLVILPDKCTGCGECCDVCDDEAIEGKNGFIHMISDADCVKCGKCMAVCSAGAIVPVSGIKPRLPKRLVKVGQFA
jgi:NADH:ubiquinone oxidoreductase subunit F (NADH-binding)/NAD-dependent dihydropyrimidine dehydrogenase PreA subunit